MSSDSDMRPMQNSVSRVRFNVGTVSGDLESNESEQRKRVTRAPSKRVVALILLCVLVVGGTAAFFVSQHSAARTTLRVPTRLEEDAPLASSDETESPSQQVLRGSSTGDGSPGLTTPLSLLAAGHGAVCLDGSPGAFYHRPALPSGSPTKWILVLGDGDGVSECADKVTCRSRTKSRFGSSALLDPTLEAVSPAPPLSSTDCDALPGFCSWHYVLVPYCSQDLWSGRVTQPTKKTWGRTFAGHEILSAVLDSLQTAGLSEATELMLVGTGAGGHGVWANADYVAERLPKTRVKALVLNAFHTSCGVVAAYGGSGRVAVTPAADWSCTALAQRATLWDAYVDTGCASAAAQASGSTSSGGCLLGATAAPHVKTPVFIAQAIFDRPSLETHFGLPASVLASTAGPGGRAPPGALNYLTAWRQALLKALASVGVRRGVFAPACTQSLVLLDAAGPRIQDKSLAAALGDWYVATQPATASKRPATPAAHLIDACGGTGSAGAPLACNPSCEGRSAAQ